MKKLTSTYIPNLILLIFISLILQSCKPDDKYYKISDEARGFFVFNEGDVFKLKNETTNEIIEFTITSKEFSFYEYSANYSALSFGIPPADTYYETGTYRFADSSNCYRGEIRLDSNTVNTNGIYIELYGCFDSQGYSQYEDSGVIDVAGTEYQNSYLFSSYPNKLFYSKEKGILKIVDYDGITKFSIVE